MFCLIVIAHLSQPVTQCGHPTLFDCNMAAFLVLQHLSPVVKHIIYCVKDERSV